MISSKTETRVQFNGGDIATSVRLVPSHSEHTPARGRLSLRRLVRPQVSGAKLTPSDETVGDTVVLEFADLDALGVVIHQLESIGLAMRIERDTKRELAQQKARTAPELASSEQTVAIPTQEFTNGKKGWKKTRLKQRPTKAKKKGASRARAAH